MSDVKLNGPKTITFTPQGVAYVLDTLASRPFKEVQGLINDILTQLKSQEDSDGKT